MSGKPEGVRHAIRPRIVLEGGEYHGATHDDTGQSVVRCAMMPRTAAATGKRPATTEPIVYRDTGRRDGIGRRVFDRA